MRLIVHLKGVKFCDNGQKTLIIWSKNINRKAHNISILAHIQNPFQTSRKQNILSLKG